MWFGILTPGAHSSRATPSDEATVFAWTAADRRRIDGPLEAVHGGLRVTRRLLHDAGLPPSEPRCFGCLRPVGVPDAAAVRASPRTMRPLGEGHGLPPLGSLGTPPPVLAFVHLRDLVADEDPPLDEEALLVLAQQELRLLLPLAALPEALGVLGALSADADLPAPACTSCGLPLPGSAAQRARAEHRAAVVPRARRRRASHGRRAA